MSCKTFFVYFDWILSHIIAGYYRVTYDTVLWERIIEALEDPDRREEIHPLNRATVSNLN